MISKLLPNKFQLFLICSILALTVGGFVTIRSSTLCSKALTNLRQEKKSLNRLYPAILANLKLINNSPIFASEQMAKNAEPYLSQHISWLGGGIQPVMESAKLNRQLKIQYANLWSSPSVLKALESNKNLLSHYHVSWMNRLMGFNYFSILSRPEVAAKLKKLKDESDIARISTIASLPMPNFMELRSWAALYLIKSHLRGHTKQGFAMVRKVAELANSSHTLIGAMIAVDLLTSEHYFADQFHFSHWRLIPEKNIQAYKHAVWAMNLLVRAPLLGQLPSQFAPYMTPQNGVCAGALGAADGYPAFQQFLEPQFPGELNFHQQIAQSKSQLRHYFRICGMEQLDALLTPAAQGLPVDHIPFVRRAVALTLLAASTPSLAHLN